MSIYSGLACLVLQETKRNSWRRLSEELTICYPNVGVAPVKDRQAVQTNVQAVVEAVQPVSVNAQPAEKPDRQSVQWIWREEMVRSAANHSSEDRQTVQIDVEAPVKAPQSVSTDNAIAENPDRQTYPIAGEGKEPIKDPSKLASGLGFAGWFLRYQRVGAL